MISIVSTVALLSEHLNPQPPNGWDDYRVQTKKPGDWCSRVEPWVHIRSEPKKENREKNIFDDLPHYKDDQKCQVHASLRSASSYRA